MRKTRFGDRALKPQAPAIRETPMLDGSFCPSSTVILVRRIIIFLFVSCMATSIKRINCRPTIYGSHFGSTPGRISNFPIDLSAVHLIASLLGTVSDMQIVVQMPRQKVEMSKCRKNQNRMLLRLCYYYHWVCCTYKTCLNRSITTTAPKCARPKAFDWADFQCFETFAFPLTFCVRQILVDYAIAQIMCAWPENIPKFSFLQSTPPERPHLRSDKLVATLFDQPFVEYSSARDSLQPRLFRSLLWGSYSARHANCSVNSLRVTNA